MDNPAEIRDRRTKLGITQVELAEASGVAQATLSRLEAGGSCLASTVRVVLDALHAAETR